MLLHCNQNPSGAVSNITTLRNITRRHAAGAFKCSSTVSSVGRGSIDFSAFKD